MRYANNLLKNPATKRLSGKIYEMFSMVETERFSVIQPPNWDPLLATLPGVEVTSRVWETGNLEPPGN